MAKPPHDGVHANRGHIPTGVAFSYSTKETGMGAAPALFPTRAPIIGGQDRRVVAIPLPAAACRNSAEVSSPDAQALCGTVEDAGKGKVVSGKGFRGRVAGGGDTSAFLRGGAGQRRGRAQRRRPTIFRRGLRPLCIAKQNSRRLAVLRCAPAARGAARCCPSAPPAEGPPERPVKVTGLRATQRETTSWPTTPLTAVPATPP